jgi:hypothetical protein
MKSIVTYRLVAFEVERREGGSSRCESMLLAACFMVGQRPQRINRQTAND